MRKVLAAFAGLLALLGGGCGPEIEIVEREVERWPLERAPMELSVRIEPVLGGGERRRFRIEFERAWRVRGERVVEVISYERPFNTGYEIAEMTVGILGTPFYVLVFPILYPLSRGLGNEDATIGGYFAVIPKRLLNPTRNDFFREDVLESVEARRSIPYADRRVESVPEGEYASIRVEFVDLVARPRQDPSRTFVVLGAALEQGRWLEFPRPADEVDEYVLRVRVEGEPLELAFQDD